MPEHDLPGANKVSDVLAISCTTPQESAQSLIEILEITSRAIAVSKLLDGLKLTSSAENVRYLLARDAWMLKNHLKDFLADQFRNALKSDKMSEEAARRWRSIFLSLE